MAPMAHESKTTTDQNEIKRWVEERGGKPAMVEDTMNGGSGLLRISFGGSKNELKEVSWDDFFNTFEENNLAFLYQDETAEGEQSRFFKFIERE